MTHQQASEFLVPPRKAAATTKRRTAPLRPADVDAEGTRSKRKRACIELETASNEAARIFKCLKEAQLVVEREAYLSQLWKLLCELRVKHGVTLNFAAHSTSSTNEQAWISRSSRALFSYLDRCVESDSPEIARLGLSFLVDGLRVESIVRAALIPPIRRFPLRLMDRIVMNVLRSAAFAFVLEELEFKYIREFQDFRFYIIPALISAIRLLESEPKESPKDTPYVSPGASSGVLPRSERSQRIFAFLKSLPNPPIDEATDKTLTNSNLTVEGVSRGKSSDPSIYRQRYVEAWVAYVSLDGDQLSLTPMLYKEVLAALPTRLFPFMSSPLILSKFFLTAFAHSDLAVAVQSLAGLFFLLLRSNLAEPQLLQGGLDFFDRLLFLLQPPVFSLAARTRFLRLLRMALQSDSATTEIKAAFAKKFVAVAALVEPSAALWLLAAGIRLLQSSGSTLTPMLLGVTEFGEKTAEALPSLDDDASIVFPKGATVGLEDRLSGWDAMRAAFSAANRREEVLRKASLWEVELLKLHWHPAVRELAMLFNYQIFKPNAPRVDPDRFTSSNFLEMMSLELKHFLRTCEDSRRLPFATGSSSVTSASGLSHRLLKASMSRK